MQQRPQRGTKRNYAALTIPTNWTYENEGKTMMFKVVCWNCKWPLFYKEGPKPPTSYYNRQDRNKRSTINGLCLHCEENSSSQKWWIYNLKEDDDPAKPKAIISCSICTKCIYKDHTLAYSKCSGCHAKPENVREIMITQQPSKCLESEWEPPKRVCYGCQQQNISVPLNWRCNDCGISRLIVNKLETDLTSIFFLIWCADFFNSTIIEGQENNLLSMLPKELVQFIILLQLLEAGIVKHLFDDYDRFLRDIPICHWKYLYRCIPPSLHLLK